MGDERFLTTNDICKLAAVAAAMENNDGATSSTAVPSGPDLEQQMLAIQQTYQQKQAELLLRFQQSQAQLAWQHIRISQEVFKEYVQRQNQRTEATSNVVDDDGGGAFTIHVDDQNHNDNEDDKHDVFGASGDGQHDLHSRSDMHLHRSAAGGSGTISARTREKLKAMIHSKQRHRASDSGSPQYEPYPRPTNSSDHELRKATSEPNLKMKGVVALRAKLMERNAPVTSHHHLHTHQPNNHSQTPAFFAAPSLPNIQTHQVAPELFMPQASQETFTNPLFFSTPNILSYLNAWTATFAPTAASAQNPGGVLRWPSGSAEDLASVAENDRAFRPFDRRHMTVTLPPSQHGLLRQQLRDLVLRRKSLVREETDDDIKRESTWAASVIEFGGSAQSSSLTSASRKTTGLAYDSTMCRHQCTCGDNSQHVEHGGRVQSVWARLQETGLVDECEKVVARKAPLEYLRLCHGDSYTTFFAVSPTACLKMDAADLPLKNFVQLPCGGIGVDSDTYFNDTFTPAAVRWAVGCVVDLCCSVADGRLNNGFAIVRPPGHHAEPNQALGFCYFNSVAIAAKVLQQKMGVKKIAIVDWDVHHGNGTQLIFENDPSVLYISLHRHDGGNFFPGTGAISEVGTGAGVGFTVNIAWSGDAMGDAEYLAAWRSIISPILEEFSPDFIIVSCGFDAARGHMNALGGYNLTSGIYGWMTRKLLNYADGRVALVLEGGYDLAAISDGAEACVRALLTQPFDDRYGEATGRYVSKESYGERPNKSARTTIEKVATAHKRYWTALSTEGLDLSQREWESLRRQFANLSVTRQSSGGAEKDVAAAKKIKEADRSSSSCGDDEELEVVDNDAS